MKKQYIKALIIIVISFCGLQLTAQPLPPTGTHGTQTDQPAGAPLDGGLSILLALGAAYGGKKIRKLKIKN